MAKVIGIVSLFLAVFILAAGTAGAITPTMTTIDWEATPGPVKKTIERYKEDGTVDTIVKADKSDGRTFYEVVVKLPDQLLTLEVAPKGQLTSFKYRHASLRNGIYFRSMPTAAQKTVAELTNGAEIKKIIAEFGDGNALYEVRAITPDHHLMVLKVDKAGRLNELQTAKDPNWTPYTNGSHGHAH